MAVKVQHLRSSTASKRPTTSALLDGELSINTNVGSSGVFFKDSAGTAVIKVGPAEVGSSAPNVTPASGGSTGNSTGEFWLDTANTGGNSQRALKIYDGSAWQYVGYVTIGSTNVQLGAAATTTFTGLTSVTSTAFVANTNIDLANQADLRFFEATGNGTNYVGLQAPASIASDVLWTLPSADGTNGQVLSTNGSGTLAWTSAGSPNSIFQLDSAVTVTDTGSDGNIAFKTDNTVWWNVENDGDLVPQTDSDVDLGSTSKYVATAYIDDVKASASVGLQNQADLLFYEATGNGTNYVGFQAPATIASDVLWTLPSADGTANQVLTTNGSGTLSWTEARTNDITQGDTSVTVTDTGSDGTVTFVTDGSTRWTMSSAGHLLPGADSTYNIGAAANEVSNIYVDTLTCQTLATLNGDVDLGNAATDSITFTGRVDSDLNPIANNTYKLGSSGLVWSEVRGTNLYGAVQEVTVLKSLGSDSGTATATAQTITISGGTGLSSTGSGTTVTVNLDNTAVTPASYGSASQVATFTVDAQGRLTAAANATISITASQVSDFNTAVRTNRLDQMAAPTASVDLNNQRITSLATPLLPSDAATKQYADSIAQSLNVHGAADYATTGAVSYTYASGGTALTITTISGTDTITFSANHGLSINSQVRTGDTTTGTGLTANATYYVTSIPATNQVKVSSTYGGANATLTNGTGLSIGVTGDPGVGATLSGCPDTVDSGSTLTVGQRILVKNHSTAAYNGVYSVTTVGTGANGVWTRTSDFDNGPTGEITAGDYVFVANGTINGSNGFVQTANPPIRMGISGAGYTTFTGDTITFTQFSGAGQITAGDGLTKSGNTLSVVVDSRAAGTATTEIVSDEVRVSSTWVGQTSLTTLGTITTGTWNANAIGLAYGGTGQSNTSVSRYYAFMGPNNAAGNASFREILCSDIAPISGGSFDAGTY